MLQYSKIEPTATQSILTNPPLAEEKAGMVLKLRIKAENLSYFVIGSNPAPVVAHRIPHPSFLILGEERFTSFGQLDQQPLLPTHAAKIHIQTKNTAKVFYQIELEFNSRNDMERYLSQQRMAQHTHFETISHEDMRCMAELALNLTHLEKYLPDTQDYPSRETSADYNRRLVCDFAKDKIQNWVVTLPHLCCQFSPSFMAEIMGCFPDFLHEHSLQKTSTMPTRPLARQPAEPSATAESAASCGLFRRQNVKYVAPLLLAGLTAGVVCTALYASRNAAIALGVGGGLLFLCLLYFCRKQSPEKNEIEEPLRKEYRESNPEPITSQP